LPFATGILLLDYAPVLSQRKTTFSRSVSGTTGFATSYREYPVTYDNRSPRGEVLTLSVEEAAPLFPCSPRWLTEQLRSGQLPGRKIGRSWRLTEDEIHEGLDRLRKQTELNADPRGLAARRRSQRKTGVLGSLAKQQAATGTGEVQ